jgi:hypothetical protein
MIKGKEGRLKIRKVNKTNKQTKMKENEIKTKKQILKKKES